MKLNKNGDVVCTAPGPAGAVQHDPSCKKCQGASILSSYKKFEADHVRHLPGVIVADIMNDIAIICRLANDTWWRDPKTQEPIKRNKGELLALIHSEISECLEGERKNLQDDHLSYRPMAEVELADALIRIFDYAGEFGYDIGGALVEKMAYNTKRADHKPENRQAGGKQF